MGIGIAGYGTVGRAAGEIVMSNADTIARRTGVLLQLSAVCRRSSMPADCVPAGVRVVSDWRQIVEADDVHVVVETIGGTDAAFDIVRSSLERGKAVVTANKNLLAEHGDKLFDLASEKQLPLGFEATVAGGVPIVRAISELTATDCLRAVYGILNGTANYILSKMESEGTQFDVALKEAQQAGYAEADPTFDIEGIDARDKLCILARLAFAGKLRATSIPVMGITRVSATDIHYASRLDSTIRLVAAGERNGENFELSVRPWMVNKHSMLAKVQGVHNAVFLVGEKVGTQMFYGRGAGGGPTGAAVVADLVEISRQFAAGRLTAKKIPGFQDSRELTLCPQPRPVPWYLRLTVADHSGIIAHVAHALAEQSININSVIQEPNMPKSRLSFVITVEPVSEPVMRRAVEQIDRAQFMLEPVLLLRIE
ncbi:MAG: homoserine dehydrogenase [Acidobacteria bacterium]|nr:homoserine dehydrogenase [Acidobacteriota bacterium]